MAGSRDSFSKREREKKKRKKKKEKAERKEQRKAEDNTTPEFMYQDEFGNLTATPPDPTRKKKEIKLEDIIISTPPTDESEDQNVRRTGLVKFFNQEKGFGFISENGTNHDFFVHIANLIDEVNDGDKVVFDVDSGPKGLIAVNVVIDK